MDNDVENKKVSIWAGLVGSAIALAMAIIIYIRRRNLPIPETLKRCVDPLKLTLDFLTGQDPSGAAIEAALASSCPPQKSAKACCAEVKKCGCPKTDADAPELLELPSARTPVNTYVMINRPSSAPATYVVEPFNTSGPAYNVTNKNDGTYAITDVAGEGGPADGIYSLVYADISFDGVFDIYAVDEDSYGMSMIGADNGLKFDDGVYTLTPSRMPVNLVEPDESLDDVTLTTIEEEEAVDKPAPVPIDYDHSITYFIGHTSLPGLYKLYHCDARGFPIPVEDGVYALWDVDFEGSNQPSAIRDAAYQLRRLKGCISPPKAADAGVMICERQVKVVCESNPDGTNVTTITRKIVGQRQQALNALYPGFNNQTSTKCCANEMCMHTGAPNEGVGSADGSDSSKSGSADAGPNAAPASSGAPAPCATTARSSRYSPSCMKGAPVFRLVRTVEDDNKECEASCADVREVGGDPKVKIDILIQSDADDVN